MARHLFIVPPNAGVRLRAWCQEQAVGHRPALQSGESLEAIARRQRAMRAAVLVVVHEAGDPRANEHQAWSWSSVSLVDMQADDARLTSVEHELVARGRHPGTIARILASPEDPANAPA